jgi:hypothetical protein
MSVYPDVITEIPATLPLQHSSSQSVTMTEFDNGVEQRRLNWDSVRRNVKLRYDLLYFDKANELRRFYEARKGPFESFNFFFPQDEIFVNELIGVVTVTGLTSIMLPSLGATSYTLTINTAPLTESIDWFFHAGTPPDIEDKAEFAPGLAVEPGDVFTFDFTGRLKIKARFGTSPLVFSDIKKYWSATRVDLVGLEPEVVSGGLP